MVSTQEFEKRIVELSKKHPERVKDECLAQIAIALTSIATSLESMNKKSGTQSYIK